MGLVSPTLIISSASCVIAAGVAFVGFQQWRLSRENLRLNLYDRRFQTRYMSEHWRLFRVGFWETTQKELRAKAASDFIVAMHESLFLFKKNSGIHSLLLELHKRSFEVTTREQTRSALEHAPPEMKMQHYNKHISSWNWISTVPEKLEQLMQPYLQFGQREWKVVTFTRRNLHNPAGKSLHELRPRLPTGLLTISCQFHVLASMQ